MKQGIKIGLLSMAIAMSLAGCTPAKTQTQTETLEVTEPETSQVKQTGFKDGVYTASSDAFETQGAVELKDVVTIEVINGEIATVDWNQEIKGGGDRQSISKASQDMVNQGGAHAPWFEQSQTAGEYIVKTQSLTAPDAISGVTVEIVDFYGLVNKAMKEAK